MPHKDPEQRRRYQRQYDATHSDATTRSPRTSYLAKKRQELRTIVRAAKDKPCTDCGGDFPFYVMQLDHVRGRKLFDMSTAIAQAKSFDALKREIEKCEPVCANCHAERTYRRRLDAAAEEIGDEMDPQLSLFGGER